MFVTTTATQPEIDEARAHRVFVHTARRRSLEGARVSATLLRVHQTRIDNAARHLDRLLGRAECGCFCSECCSPGLAKITAAAIAATR